MPADTDSSRERTSRLVVAFAVVLASLPLIAMTVGGWMWWQQRTAAVVSGSLRSLATERQPPAAAAHPLLAAPRPAAWQLVADGRQLGRGGSTVFEDARSVFGALERRAVAAQPLRSGMVAWASPAQVRLVDPTRRAPVARVNARDGRVSAVAVAGERLIVAGQRHLTAFGDDNRVTWRREVAASGEGTVQLDAVDDDALVSVIGTGVVQRLDGSSGEPLWELELPGVLTHVRRVSSTRAVAVLGDRGTTRVRAIALESGKLQWERSWRGWRAGAVASDGTRVVVGLVQGAVDARCAASGLVELDAAGGSTKSALALDARVMVSSMRVDTATGRLAALVAPRPCSVAVVEPRIDVYGARGLTRLHQVALPARPCSQLATRQRLLVVATCDELVAVDALHGTRVWSHPLPDVRARRAVQIAATPSRLAITDDVGTLAMLEPPSHASG